MSRSSQRRVGPLRRSLLRPALLLVALALPSSAVAQHPFIRGDVNFDEHVTIADLSFLVDSFMPIGPMLPCPDAGDTNDVGIVDFNDATYFVDYLMRDLAVPDLPPPFTTIAGDALEAGPDPTPDTINCPPTLIIPHGPPHPGFQMKWEAPPTAVVGEQVEVFLSVTTADPIDAFSIAYRVNNKAFSLQSVDLQDTIFPAGLRATFEASDLFETRLVSSPHPDFDLLIVTSVFADDTLPHNRILFPATTGTVTDQRLLRIVFDVLLDAPTDEEVCGMTPSEPPDYKTQNAGLTNEFALLGMSRIPATQEKMTVKLDPDEAVIFSRGDSNDDGAFDLSDASYTLNWLFVGGPVPGCLNAADSNDDGVIDISDPTHTLGYLFSGTVASMPSPGFPDCDVDPPDEDELFCLFYTSCPE